ncbi:MAG: 2,3-bisphosphoglycerate-independent phosphoglycerate mutase [Nitrospirae bacterium]|nr:2,3-bisphosphoglycerate-independent phosphoglycerate mutase [Nitrospirota bacterium]
MQDIIKGIIQKNNSKIMMVVLDGLGGLPVHGKSELEVADTPNLDMLARNSACGLHIPVSPGITPGSGPGHLALFGYNPIEWQIGRGVLEALGLGIDLKKTDVAIRCNYATIEKGIIKDRRAERIPTDKSKKITERLQEKIRKIDDVDVIFAPGMEHRFAVVLRFPKPLEKGSADIKDTDPQKEGNPPVAVTPGTTQAEKVAEVVEKLIKAVSAVIRDQKKANFILLRGFSQVPHIPHFADIYGLNPLAVAAYPMYRGLAKLIGMDAPAITGDVQEEIKFLKQNYKKYDFFFLHVKKVDSYGEDGNFKGKAEQIERFDRDLAQILALDPDVLIITGDHSTPSLLKGHSWHPVPVLLKSPYVFGGLCKSFSERECTKGELGIFPTINLMPLALANALRLKKFGA